MAKKIIISIEGTIGAGKSTILEHLSLTTPFNLIKEPVGVWNRRGSELLTKFYANPQVYAEQLQTKIMETYVEYKSVEGVNIQERSIFSAYYLFTALLAGMEIIGEDCFGRLTESFEKTLEQSEKPHAFIWLKAPTRLAMKRMIKRNGIDKNLSLKYLRGLSAIHYNLFSECKDLFKVPILIVDSGQPVSKVCEQIAVFIEHLEKLPISELVQQPRLNVTWRKPNILQAHKKYGSWEAVNDSC